MRVCEPAIALDNVWHILEVLEGSPAESAGLVPFGDWIVGWSGGVLRGENDFLDVVEAVSPRTFAWLDRTPAKSSHSMLRSHCECTYIHMTSSKFTLFCDMQWLSFPEFNL